MKEHVLGSMENLRKVYEQASKHEVESACESYQLYHDLTAHIASEFGFEPTVGAAVFAALSPNNDYLGNLRDARTLLRSAREGLTLDEFKVSTYGQNKRKAWAIAHGARPLDLIVAKKTRSFFLNIDNPKDPWPVTVDGHMFNIWRGKRENIVGVRGLSPRVYDEIAQGVRDLAREVGFVSCEVQAILWMAWRRMHGIRAAAQLELWHRDRQIAGQGFVAC